MAKKKEVVAVELPDRCCGRCDFVSVEKDGMTLCWADPPKYMAEEEAWVRGNPVGPDFPPCVHFKQKLNA